MNLQRNSRCDTISRQATTTPSTTVPDNNDINVTTPTMIPVNDTTPIITNDDNVTKTTTIPVNDYTQVITQRPLTNDTLNISLSLDPRLLLNTTLTKHSFTDIIKEYSSSDPTNATTNFIINNSLRPRIQYRTKQSQGSHHVSGNDFTPTNIHNNCLVASYNRELYSKFMTIENIFQ